MGDVVNLRLRRKQSARTERERQAAENRVRFGRSRLERHAADAEAERAEAALDGHRIVAPPPGGDTP